jgi:hypothetical protein
MQTSMRFVLAAGLVAFGYFLGSSNVLRVAVAQPEDSAPSDDAIKKIAEAHDALKKAAAQLALESRYTSVTKSVNPFAILVGGINAKDDLEGGHGVDPETYVALNVATYELKKNRVKDETLADWVDTSLLGYDNEGHLTYRNKVVRIYSISKLRKLNAQRMIVLGETKEQKQSK